MRSGTLPRHEVPPDAESKAVLFAGLFGLLLGMSLLKFGNPVILDHLIDTPRGWDEWRVFAWPLRIGFLGLGLVTAAALGVIRWREANHAPLWLLGLLAGWLVWQFMAALRSTDPELTRMILAHFVSCAACFALGNLALARVMELRVFWTCLVLSFVVVLGLAFEQHFGGLDATRKMILENSVTTPIPPEYMARIQSNRVFSTLVYPNALAGAILLLLPISTMAAFRLGGLQGSWTARVLGAGILVAGLAVLVWSGSKAGWLLAMGLALFLLFDSPLTWRVKASLALGFLVIGLASFGLVYSKKLSRGATSVSARFDYWTAAVRGFAESPVLGHGPGGFKRVYSRLRPDNAEMAQLAHNDYLQQATDSGLIGFLAYAGFVIGSLACTFRGRKRAGDPILTAVWLGLAGWFAQGMLEFGLYIPATSWCAFALLGWVVSQRSGCHPNRTRA